MDGLNLNITASAGAGELSQHLTKVETAIFRHKTITFDYYSLQRDSLDARKVDPYHLLFQDGQFYLVGRSHERDAIRVFRLDRIRGKVAYATKAEHDFKRPEGFDPRRYANRAGWQFGDAVDTARCGSLTASPGRSSATTASSARSATPTTGSSSATPYADARQLASFVLGLREHAAVLSPPELVEDVAQRVARLRERHASRPDLAPPVPPHADDDVAVETGARRQARVLDPPERFARLVTLASVLIEAGRRGQNIDASTVRERLQISDAELQEDINVLNVVSFGGGTYVLYAELLPDGTIEVDPEPYADNFARPARLLPVEAKALVAAIDLIGDHLPAGALTTARDKIVGASAARTRASSCTSPPRRPTTPTSPAGSPSASTSAASSSSSTTRRTRTSSPARRRALPPLQRDRGLVRVGLRPRPRRACARSAWTASRPPRSPTRPSSRARDHRRERRRRLDAHGELEESRTARIWVSPERAPLVARGPPRRAGARGRLGHRRARLQGQRLARARGPQGGRRRRGARAGRRARGRADRDRPPAHARRRGMSRRDQIKMTEDEVLAFLDEEKVVVCATNGKDGFPHLMPLWYVVRDGELWAWTFAKSQKVKNLERDAAATVQVEAGTEYQELRGVMLKTEVEVVATPTGSPTSGSTSSAATPAEPAANWPTRCARWSSSRPRSAWRCASPRPSARRGTTASSPPASTRPR
jgi:proteasome accessory factor C